MKTKVSIAIFVVIILVTGYFAFFSNSVSVEAKRVLLIDGDLYSLSSLYGNNQITHGKDTKILFEEKNGKILFGKGFESMSGEVNDFASTRLFILNETGAEEQISNDANVFYALSDKDMANVVYLTEGYNLYKYNVATKKTILLTTNASRPDISKDGKKIVYLKLPKDFAGDNGFDQFPGIAILDLETLEERILPNSNRQGDHAPHFTPNGQHILLSGLAIMNIDGSEYTKLIKQGDGISNLSIEGNSIWSPDGRYFIHEFNNEIIVLELNITNKRLVSAGAIAYGISPKWVEEGKTISVLAPDKKIGDDILSVVNLNGKVLSGDKSKEGKYYKNSKTLLRLRPQRVSTNSSNVNIASSENEIVTEVVTDDKSKELFSSEGVLVPDKTVDQNKGGLLKATPSKDLSATLEQ